MHPPAPAAAGTANPVADRSPLADAAFWLLLTINLFNYLDRYILAAVLPKVKAELLAGHPDQNYWANLLSTGFLVTYTLIAPAFGWLGDRIPNRWPLIGLAVIVWSLVSGASGLAAAYGMMLATRCLIGVGEAAYAPAGLALISDSYSLRQRARAMAYFSVMIPVGSALGYLFGGVVADALGWRWAFYLVVPPGVLLGLVCFWMRDPGRGGAQVADAPRPPAAAVSTWRAWGICLRTPSYALDLAGYTAMTFVVGGLAIVGPSYVYEREGRYTLTADVTAKLAGGPAAGVLDRLRPLAGQTFVGADAFKAALRDKLAPAELTAAWGTVREAAHDPAVSPSLGSIATTFGGIIVLAGLTATLSGSWLAGRLRPAVPSSDFLVSGAAALLGVPAYVAFLYVPFPAAWAWLFVTVFLLFVNTGPVNAIFANVTAPAIRANAFALAIFGMHALGDVISPPIIGWLTDRYDWATAFLSLAGVLAASGLFWLAGTAFLARDVDLAPTRVG